MKQKVLYILLFLFACAWNTQVKANEASISGTNWNKISNNTISWGGCHANFKLSGGSMEYGKTLGGYIDISKDTYYYLTCESNSGCKIKITKIHVKAGSAKASCTFYLGNKSDGCGWSNTEITLDNLSYSNGDQISMHASNGCRIYQIDVTFSITPDAPTATPTTTTLDVTTNTSTPNNLVLTDYFTTGDHYSGYWNFGMKDNPQNAGILNGDKFYATKAGTYKVDAKISALENCHEESGKSTLTITVNRVDGSIETENASMKALDTYDLSRCIKSSLGTGTISYEVVSDNKSSATISGNNFTPSASGTYTIKATKAQDDQYKEASTQFTVNVSRIENTLSIIEEQTIKVDDIIENVYTNNNSDAEITYAFSNINYLDETKNKGFIGNLE